MPRPRRRPGAARQATAPHALYLPARAGGKPASAEHQGVQRQTKLAAAAHASMTTTASACRTGLPAARHSTPATSAAAAAPAPAPSYKALALMRAVHKAHRAKHAPMSRRSGSQERYARRPAAGGRRRRAQGGGATRSHLPIARRRGWPLPQRLALPPTHALKATHLAPAAAHQAPRPNQRESSLFRVREGRRAVEQWEEVFEALWSLQGSGVVVVAAR